MQDRTAENRARHFRFGVGKKYWINTFGCQMNEHDSEVIAALIENLGYDPAFEPEEADLIIINTCAVRKKPEDKVASMLGKLLALKQQKQDLIIAVGGCMTQQEDSAYYIKNRFKQVDLIFGTHALPRLPNLLDLALKNRETIIDIGEDYPEREGLPAARVSSFQAWLPIIYGCDNYCSYCVVPYVRGRERSRRFQDIVTEAAALAQKGYREITLLGQNVNSYGRDLPDSRSFADLLAGLNRIEGLRRVRFMTSHPKDLSPAMIKEVARGEKICEHFHLPVQSGSNRILELMNRRYSREHYLDLVRAVKETVPGVSITSDIIVGFPGETENDFLETADLIEKARFDSAFAFIYSPRKKTAAEKLKDTVPYAEKEKRLQFLNKIQQRISLEENELLVNRDLEVLVEGSSKSNLALATGRTRTNKLVHFPGPAHLAGRLIRVRITGARTWNLLGEMEGEPY